MLPAWWRFSQCIRRYYDTRLVFPHLVNAGKYATTIITIWLSAAQNITDNDNTRNAWIVFLIVATCYSYSWDVIMDWGFFQRKSKNFLLRDELIYSWKWVYYFAIISNFFLRVSWVFLVSVGTYSTGIDRRALIYLIACAEALRRFQWNFFRLENEHSNNCGQFRVVKEVPLPYAIMSTHLAASDSTPPTDDSDLAKAEAYAALEAMGVEEGRMYAGREYDTKETIERRKASVSSRPNTPSLRRQTSSKSLLPSIDPPSAPARVSSRMEASVISEEDEGDGIEMEVRSI
jgi:hypothetical protein